MSKRFGKGGVKVQTTDVGAQAAKAKDFGGDGDHLLLNSAAGRMKLIFASKDKDLVVRPFGALDPANPDTKFLRHRAGAGDHQQTPWIVLMDVANFVGSDKNRVTFILNGPNADPAEAKANPYRVFYWNAYRANKNGKFADGKEWPGKMNALFSRDGNRGAGLSPPDTLGFMQGAVLLNGDKNYLKTDAKRKVAVPYGLGEDDALPIIKLGRATALSLLGLLDRRKKDADDEENVQKQFRYDVIGFKNKEGGMTGGRILEFFKAGPKVVPGDVSTWDGSPPENKLGLYSYHCNLLKEYQIGKGDPYTADLSPEAVARIFEIANFWLDFQIGKTTHPGILRIMSYEEQAAEIAKAFKTAGSLLRKCWEENDEFLTEEVEGILKSKVSSVVPSEDDEDEGDEDEEETTTKKKKKDKKKEGKKSPASSKYKDEDEEDEETEDEETEDEEDEDSEDEESDDDDSEAEDEESEDEESEDEEDEESEDDDSEAEDEESEDEEEDDSEAEDEESEDEESEDEDEEEEEEDEESEDESSEEDEEEEEEEEDEDDEDEDLAGTPAVSDKDIEAARKAADKAGKNSKKRAPQKAEPPKPSGKGGKSDAKKPDPKKSGKSGSGKPSSGKPSPSSSGKSSTGKSGKTTAGRR